MSVQIRDLTIKQTILEETGATGQPSIAFATRSFADDWNNPSMPRREAPRLTKFKKYF